MRAPPRPRGRRGCSGARRRRRRRSPSDSRRWSRRGNVLLATTIGVAGPPSGMPLGRHRSPSPLDNRPLGCRGDLETDSPAAEKSLSSASKSSLRDRDDRGSCSHRLALRRMALHAQCSLCGTRTTRSLTVVSYRRAQGRGPPAALARHRLREPSHLALPTEDRQRLDAAAASRAGQRARGAQGRAAHARLIER